MSRLLRPRGRSTLNKKKLIYTLFAFSLLLFVVLGFGFGTHSAYALEEAVLGIASNSSNIPLVKNVIQENADNSLFPPKVVTIITNTSQDKYMVFGNTVADVITATNTYLDENDITVPAMGEYIGNNSSIRIIDVDVVTMLKDEKIPFKTIKKDDKDINSGTQVISQKGANGNMLKTMKVYYHDGVAVRSELVKQEVTLKAVNEIIKIGTKPFTIQSCPYWDKVIDTYVDPVKKQEKNKWMKFVMRCETWCDSGQNTRNVYLGLYQFNQRTFKAYGGTNIWDGTDQIKTVSRMVDLPGNRAHHWPSCNSSYLRATGN